MRLGAAKPLQNCVQIPSMRRERTLQPSAVLSATIVHLSRCNGVAPRGVLNSASAICDVQPCKPSACTQSSLSCCKAAATDSLDHAAYLQGFLLPAEVKYLRQTLEVCIKLALLAIVSRPASKGASCLSSHWLHTFLHDVHLCVVSGN